MQFGGLTYSQRLSYGWFHFMDHFLGRDRARRLTLKPRKKLYRRIAETLKEKGIGKLIPIDRRKDLSLREFQEHYVKKGIPVVMEGAAKDWACCQKWSMDYFKELHGEDEIVIVNQDMIQEDYETTTLRHVIDNIQEGANRYYRFYPLLERHPEHILDFDINWLKERTHKHTIFKAWQVFIGAANTETLLHNANQCNLFVQAYGEKQWIIFPPHYTAIIDPNPVTNVYRNGPYKTGEPFNFFKPDHEGYPLYKYIDRYSVHLKAGDVLWNPSYWWHTIRNPTDSIGVGYRWISPSYCLRTGPLYFLLDLLATNPPIWRSLRLYRRDTHLLLLAETGRLKEYLKRRAASL